MGKKRFIAESSKKQPEILIDDTLMRLNNTIIQLYTSTTNHSIRIPRVNFEFGELKLTFIKNMDAQSSSRWRTSEVGLNATSTRWVG